MDTFEIQRIIGNNLQTERKKQGYTQTALAKKSPYSSNFVSMVESNSTKTTIARLFLLADLLGMTFEDMLEGVIEPKTVIKEVVKTVEVPSIFWRDKFKDLLRIILNSFNEVSAKQRETYVEARKLWEDCVTEELREKE